MKYQNKEMLARMVVDRVVQGEPIPAVAAEEVAENLRQPGACFVTLYVDDKLHGCIGSVEARQLLYQDIVENAVGAATKDWRFPPLTGDELNRLRVEVSVLTPLVPYLPISTTSLLQDLERDKPGLVIEKDGCRAIFLPQVWKQLPHPEVFLQHLCLKAGLYPDSWQTGMQFQVFTVTDAKSEGA